MPTYRTITIELRSQFDILPMAEYAPPDQPSKDSKDAASPKLNDEEKSIVSVYIPTYPCSQFWICYAIHPPYPPKTFFVFKLFVDGAYAVTWSCGEAERFGGKTVFGLFDTEKNRYWGIDTQLEKRAFCFAGQTVGRVGGRSADGEDDQRCIELRVYRADGRKRIQRPAEEYSQTVLGARKGNGVDLIKAGHILKTHPQRYYKFRLVDPLDQPFATFRYYYRTRDELEALGIDVDRLDSDRSFMSSTHSSFAHSQAEDSFDEPYYASEEACYPARTGLSTESSEFRDVAAGEMTTLIRRLSIPPSRTLQPSASTPHMPSPVKNMPGAFVRSPTGTERDEDLQRRTPSPTKTESEKRGSPSPSPKRRLNSTGILRDVVASALRRRVASGDE